LGAREQLLRLSMPYFARRRTRVAVAGKAYGVRFIGCGIPKFLREDGMSLYADAYALTLALLSLLQVADDQKIQPAFRRFIARYAANHAPTEAEVRSLCVVILFACGKPVLPAKHALGLVRLFGGEPARVVRLLSVYKVPISPEELRDFALYVFKENSDEID
jgi:hypothetical protein